MRLSTWLLMGLCGVILAPAMASAQGSIAGTVKDSSGAVLPGVTVEAASPALIEKVRSVSTDGTGQYKIIDLRPGVYTVTFTLQGFNAVKREGIELVGSFAASVNAELKVGSVTETVVVTGESPIVDIQSVAKQQVLTKDVIDALPAGRNHFDQAVLIPGLQASQPGRGALMDVGGTNNLQNTTATMHGNRSADTRVLVDGIAIRNIGSEGQFSNFVPDTGSTQETTFDYGAISSEQAFGGLRINLVPREGGNRFSASAFGTGANSSFQGNNYTDDLKARGLTAPNSLNQMYDVNFSGGGPIVKDRLWFFSSTRFQANKNNVAGVFENLNAGLADKWTYVPNPDKQGVFSMTQNSVNTRLTAQVTPRNKVSVYYENQGRVWFDERATVSPEAATTRLFPKEWIGAIGWTSPLTSRLLLDAHFGNHAEVYYQPVPYPGDPFDLIPVTEQSSGLLYRAPGLADPCCFTGSAMPHIYNSSASLSYVTGAHAVKVGFSNISGRITNSSFWSSTGLSYRFNNGVPNQITERATPFQTVADLDAEFGLFAQDKWTLKRTTINAGVRFDTMRTSFPEQSLGPAPLVPNRNVQLAAVSRQNLKDISPRLGIVYDLFGDGKTAVKVMLGKYVLATVPGAGNPIGNLSTNVTRNWTDANGNFVADCDLLNPQQQDLRSSGRDFCGTISDTRFGSVLPSTAIDPLTYTGWANRAYNYEFSTGVQRQIAPRVGLDFGYFRRWYGNFQTTDNRSITGADFDPYSIVAPVNPGLPNGGGYTVSGLYNLNPSKVGQVDNYVTFTDNFGKQIEHWNGVDLSINARPGPGIVLQGGFSTGRTSTDNCAVALALDSPSQLYCHVDTAFLTQVKLLGTYTVPKVDVRIAATFQTYPGPAIAANYVATNAEVQPTLGRPLSGGATNVTVNVVAPGTMYGERASQLDFRFSKLLRFGRTRTGVNFDLANILNSNPALTQNNNYASWQVPTGIMDARLAKFSVQFDF